MKKREPSSEYDLLVLNHVPHIVYKRVFLLELYFLDFIQRPHDVSSHLGIILIVYRDIESHLKHRLWPVFIHERSHVCNLLNYLRGFI